MSNMESEIFTLKYDLLWKKVMNIVIISRVEKVFNFKSVLIRELC